MAENSPPSRLDDGSTSKKPVSLLENRPGRKKTDSIDLHEISGLAWLWAVEGVRPDRWDTSGALVCLVDATIIIAGPR